MPEHERMTIGVVAKRSGVSVRTLHHYDHLGLLVPVARTPSGRRLYDAASVTLARQVKVLRGLGFSLPDIAMLMREPGQAAHLFDALATRMESEVTRQRRVIGRLRSATRTLRTRGGTASFEVLTDLVDDLSWLGRYFTPDQRAAMVRRAEALGAHRMERAARRWRALVDAVEGARQAGLDPLHPVARRLARRWLALVEEFTARDAALTSAVQRVWASEREIQGFPAEEVRRAATWLSPALARARGT